jgi:hypothetical protein
MKNSLLGLAIASVLFCVPVFAAPVLQVNSEVAQGNIGKGLTVVLAPGQVVSINFSKLGERVASITPGDRSQFVFNAKGSVVNLRRIKVVYFEGEFVGNETTTLNVETVGPSGQKVYPITILFSNSKPSYSVVEISHDSAAPIPAQSPRKAIPLTTAQVNSYRPVAQVSVLPIDDPIRVLAPIGNKTEVLPPPPSVATGVGALKSEPKADDIKLESKADAPVDATTGRRVKAKKEKSEIAKVKRKSKSKPEINIGKASVAIPGEIAFTSSEPKFAVSPSVTAKTQAPATAAPKHKLSSHQQANAIVLGLMHSRVSYRDFDRAQDAIWTLRQGKTLTQAAKRSGLSVQKLQQLIDKGSKKNV